MATRNSDLVLPVKLIAPVDCNGGATTGAYVDVSGSGDFAIIVETGVIASLADDMDIAVKQATNTSGGSAKALTITEAYYSTTSGKTAATVTSGVVTVTPGDDGRVLVIPIRQQQLDADNAFKTVTVTISSPGSNSALMSATLHIAGQRYNKSV